LFSLLFNQSENPPNYYFNPKFIFIVLYIEISNLRRNKLIINIITWITI
jgi:hypothetical protein